MSKDSRISTRGKIWELHIHSNQCFSSHPDLKKLKLSEYVDELLNVLEDYEDLEMISFTDHNQISLELYREFNSRKSRFALLPGIEVDVKLYPEDPGKHVIFYFDAMDDAVLERLANTVNGFMQEHSVGRKKGQSPIYIHEFLSALASLGIPALLSPHAMKTANRDIDADWHAMEDSERKGEMKKYLDQFFCFWEASGTKQIHRAAEFLREMDCGDRISMVAFSDSKDFDKLRTFLDQPCQYFNALPNFNGLKLAGSEITRIRRTQDTIESKELGRYIGAINFNGQRIELSPRLNAVIGGRGSGKSVFLDTIANHLGLPSDRLDRERIEYLETRNVTITSMSGMVIEPWQFHFDYFNQSYISKLFEKHGKAFCDALEGYFSSAFEGLEWPDESSIRRENEDAFGQALASFQAETPGNLIGLVEKYILDSEDRLRIAIFEKNRKKVGARLTGFKYSPWIESLRKAINPKIPDFLRDDETVKAALNNLYTVLLAQAYAKRTEYLESDFLFNTITDVFKQKKAEISQAQKDRNESIELFKVTFNNKTLGYRNRIALINAYIFVGKGFTTHYEKSRTLNGKRESAFKFKHELDVEHPFEYMARLFSEQMSAIRNKPVSDYANLWSYIEKFCFDEDCYKQGYTWETLYEALRKYALSYDLHPSINYLQDDGEYSDISIMSPGTQTNILIEYIVHQDTTNPLLIDQPEDNVDNQTIYNDIRTWFMTLKRSRQVIVVTHDANIVINADADNVILANQEKANSFSYDYGALEYGDILDRASTILDGGKEAVRRRLIKYGE